MLKVNNFTWKELYKLIKSYFKKNTSIFFVIGILFMIIESLISLSIPIFLGNFIDDILSIHSLLYTALIIILSLLINSISISILGYVGIKISNDMKRNLYQKIIRLPYPDISKISSGEMSSRIVSDTSTISNNISTTLPSIISNLLKIILIISFLFISNTSLTFYILILLPFLGIIIIPMSKKIEYFSINIQNILGDISKKVSQSISNIRIIKSYIAENDEVDEYDSILYSLQKTNFQSYILSTFSSFFVGLISLIIIGFILIMGQNQIKNGYLETNELVIFLLYLFQLFNSITDLSVQVSALSDLKGALIKVKEILLYNSETASHNLALEKINSITFKDVSFGYNNKNILNDISFDIINNKITAIVGPSGIGKTTIFYLLQKFYQDYEGSIKINDSELSDVNYTCIRNHISLVTQENLFFSKSIKDNLFYGKNKTNNFVDKYSFLKKNLDLDFIDQLPNGIDTIIGEAGHGLSEGQKQRINLARGYLNDSELLLLDEITSHLDPLSEDIIIEFMKKIKKHKTLLIISHKLKTISESDIVIFLNKQGKIKDIGSHEELINKSQEYKEFLAKNNNDF